MIRLNVHPVLLTVGLILGGSALQARPAYSEGGKPIKASENKIYGQRVVDELHAKYPDILAIAFHAAPPPPQKRVQQIIACTEDKIGQYDPADEVELAKLGGSMIVPGVKDGVSRYQLRTPLKDMAGRQLGLLVVSYKRDDHPGEVDQVLARQYQLTAEIAKKFQKDDDVYQPYDRPMKKAVDNKRYGQKLILGVLKKHPELFAVGLHVVEPGTSDQQIVANNIDNINSLDSPEEIIDAQRGISVIYPGVHDGVKRYQGQTPLKDSSGRIIGLLFINFPRKKDGQEAEMLKIQNEIAADLAKQIPSLESLFEPAEI